MKKAKHLIPLFLINQFEEAFESLDKNKPYEEVFNKALQKAGMNKTEQDDALVKIVLSSFEKHYLYRLFEY